MWSDQTNSVVCCKCTRGDCQDLLLLCETEGCLNHAHTFCLGLTTLPSQGYYCEECEAMREERFRERSRSERYFERSKTREKPVVISISDSDERELDPHVLLYDSTATQRRKKKQQKKLEKKNKQKMANKKEVLETRLKEFDKIIAKLKKKGGPIEQLAFYMKLSRKVYKQITNLIGENIDLLTQLL